MTEVAEQQVKRVALYLGSATGNSPAYEEATVRTVQVLAEAGYELVYGGGSVGLMGVAADTALDAGMPVHGVITRHLMDGETGHLGLDTLDIVETMTERKERMASMADAMVTLPGGIGTLEEFFEVWVGQVLGVHHKPVAIVDVDDYWRPMADMLDHMVARGFFAQEHRDRLIRVEDPGELPAALDLWTPAAAKWSR
ncbi:MAG: TIGR00730 family Rossman fold protein [Corynebacterium variabile]|uniref:LOG family protein n=1 Tax=Corynebacterium variabile TaxID=1727 RepID=UPI002648C2B6|nr:TIGR00730 family Rossman fold protein [Corynebacterium variabile]MDN6843876.1 TIGR00730 family Rossman fold protein [Corynebacterium variabile]